MSSTGFPENYPAYVAHAANGRFHDLPSHLKEVAKNAAENALPFGGHYWAYLAGLWHDLGKFRPGFQDYIRKAGAIESENAHIENGKRVSHSTAGALLACNKLGPKGRVLAYLIAGHHAGLYDWNSEFSSLEARLASKASSIELAEALAAAQQEILDHGNFVPGQPIPGASAGRPRKNCIGNQ